MSPKFKTYEDPAFYKCCLRWINSMYESCGYKSLDSLEKLKIGSEVIRFTELASNTTLPAPKLDTNHLKKTTVISSNHESILRALEFLRSKNIPLKRVTVSDIESGNSAAILELVWRVFCHFVIEPLAETPEDGVRRPNIKPKDIIISSFRNFEKYNLRVRSLKNLQDGLAMLYLISDLHPTVLDCSTLKKDNRVQNIKLGYEILLNHFLVPAVVDLDDLMDFKLQDLAFVFYLGLAIKKVKHYSPSAPFIGEENSELNTMKLKIHTLDSRLNRLDSIAQRISVGFSIMSDRNAQNSEDEQASSNQSTCTDESLMAQLQFLQTRVSHLMDTVVNQSKLVNDVINRQQVMANEYRSQNASSIPDESELDDSQIRAEYMKLRTKCLDLTQMNHELSNESQSYRKSNEELSLVIAKIASTRPVTIEKEHSYKKDRSKRHSMKAEDFRKFYKGDEHEDPPLRSERKEKVRDKDVELDVESKRKRYARRKTSSSFNLSSRLSKQQKADRNSLEELSHSEPGPSLDKVSKTSSAGDSPDKGPSISFNIPQERSKISASVTMDDLSERAKKFDREKDAPRIRSFSNRLDAPPKVSKQNTLNMDYDSD